MKKNNKDANFATRVYEAINWMGHRIPPSLMRAVSLPLDYQSKTADSFANESARMISLAFGLINNNKVYGDYAEFGVFKGHTFIEAHNAARRLQLKDMKLWAYDSFEGLPEIKNEDVGGAFRTGEFSYARDAFIQRLQKYSVDLERVEIVEGFFDETLTPGSSNRKPGQISIAWVDCDLYESTVPVLDFLTDKLAEGSVLIFDDWFCFNGRPDKGEQLACQGWLAKNPDIHLTQYQRYSWGGNSFIFNRNVAVEADE